MLCQTTFRRIVIREALQKEFIHYIAGQFTHNHTSQTVHEHDENEEIECSRRKKNCWMNQLAVYVRTGRLLTFFFVHCLVAHKAASYFGLAQPTDRTVQHTYISMNINIFNNFVFFSFCFIFHTNGWWFRFSVSLIQTL